MPNVNNRDGSVQLAARIPKRLHRALRLECAATGVTMQTWVRDALTAHLRRCQRPAMSEPTRGESA
jgi:predicted HicB family RNase H-like nuclease